MNFSAKELLPKIVFDKYGELGLRYIDTRVLACLNFIRDTLEKTIYVNTWSFASKDKPGTLQANGKPFDGRTLRLQSDSDYSTYSDHSYGRAIDFDVVGENSLDIQKYITKDIVCSTKLKELGLTNIEDSTSGWTHISVANVSGWKLQSINGIYLVPRR